MLKFSSKIFRAVITLMAVILTCPGASFAQENFVYDPQGKPDPFTPWVTSDGRLQILESKEKKGESELSLEGIIYDKYGLSYAVVNGEVVKIGDTIDGFQVLKIEEKRVIFIREGELKEMEIKEEGT
jgi:hypothetical protein